MTKPATMNLWKLEVLRLVRTKRWIALLAVYVFFGLLGPVTARYMENILGLAGGELEGAIINFPDPTPVDGMIQYVSNAGQIGTLVAMVVAAGALAFDAIPEMGVFLRTRVPSVWRILLPRLVVPFAAASLAFTLGALAAWYETWALLGPLAAGDVLPGIAYGIVFLAFVVALVAAIAQVSRSVLGTVMTSVVILLVMPLLGLIDAIARWMPTSLLNALAEIPAGNPASDYVGATVVALVASAGLVVVAVRAAGRRLS
ncbi:MAG: ABC transporter [Actinobacteria bacterium HGW-Actinobacteria-4]|nr:MAG: ABC transporter [Actinobacteria bacterium HGW-Actinobacteria-4]